MVVAVLVHRCQIARNVPALAVALEEGARDVVADVAWKDVWPADEQHAHLTVGQRLEAVRIDDAELDVGDRYADRAALRPTAGQVAADQRRALRDSVALEEVGVRREALEGVEECVRALLRADDGPAQRHEVLRLRVVEDVAQEGRRGADDGRPVGGQLARQRARVGRVGVMDDAAAADDRQHCCHRDAEAVEGRQETEDDVGAAEVIALDDAAQVTEDVRVRERDSLGGLFRSRREEHDGRVRRRRGRQAPQECAGGDAHA